MNVAKRNTREVAPPADQKRKGSDGFKAGGDRRVVARERQAAPDECAGGLKDLFGV